MTEFFSLQGQVALVTGAGQGIGQGVAQRLHAAGAKVAIFDLDLGRAQQAAGELGGIGLSGDVRSEADVNAAVKRAETLGCDLAELPLSELQALSQGITADVYEVLTPRASAGSRRSYGGTAPDQVRAQVARWKEMLK